MAFPKIGYRNILRNSAAGHTVTASSTDTGFAVADVHDYRPWKMWRSGVTTSPINIDIDLGASGAAAADYLALINTNIKALGGTVQVFADTFTPPTTSRLAAATPTYDDVDYREFTSPGALRYWRIQIAHAAPPFTAKPFIGEAFLGLKTVLTEYMNPDTDPFIPNKGGAEASVEDSESGHYLGAIMRGKTHRFQFAFGGDSGTARTFLTSDLNAFLDSHIKIQRPFVFVLDTDDTDFSQPVYLRKEPGDNIERRAVGGVWSRLMVSFPVVEAWAEVAA